MADILATNVEASYSPIFIFVNSADNFFSDTFARATELFYLDFFCLFIGIGKRNYLFSFSGSRYRLFRPGSFSWNLTSLDSDSGIQFFGILFSFFLRSGIGLYFLWFLSVLDFGNRTFLFLFLLATVFVSCWC